MDSDRVVNDLHLGNKLNNLHLYFWQTPDELHELIMKQIKEQLNLSSSDEIEGLGRSS